LGVGEPRTYLVGAQSPAELRGSGGFIGAYALMTARRGEIELGPFRPIQSLAPSRVRGVEPPNPDYARIYDPWGGAGLMHNINMTPDFPSAAVAMERLYAEVEGRSVDGVIVADPRGLAALMEVTGRARVPGLGISLSARSLVPFLANEAYGRFRDPVTRKRVLGDVAGQVLKRFLSGAARARPAAAGRALADAASGGHLLLHSVDPEVQAAFLQAGVAGRLGGVGGADYLNVVVNNISVNKVDYFVERRVRYRVTLEEGGIAEGIADVRFDNHAPRRGQQSYVIGPRPGVSGPGESVMIATAYCAPSCRVTGFSRNGRSEPVSLEEELGHPLARVIAEVPSGGSETLSYRWQVDRAWHGTTGYGTYRLVFQGQPTIRPTELEISVRAPEGMLITRTEPEMDVDGAVATWRGKPGDRAEFEVEFARPILGRLWHAVWDFLNHPVA
ncbi:MAG TPA: DUF4012 domain-containing protein, partial [Actinomycetota bacterium]|nr:DUF4012 domain-containing protein [Actinomycetota bacterium]